MRLTESDYCRWAEATGATYNRSDFESLSVSNRQGVLSDVIRWGGVCLAVVPHDKSDSIILCTGDNLKRCTDGILSKLRASMSGRFEDLYDETKQQIVGSLQGCNSESSQKSFGFPEMDGSGFDLEVRFAVDD